MQLIYVTSLAQSEFLAIVDTFFKTLFTFRASGSVWLFDRIVEIDFKLAYFKPIKGLSYLPIPPVLDASLSLINISNRQDHKCFLHCFTSAWHLKYGPLLYVASRDSHRIRTNPDTYSIFNPLPHQAIGEFHMSMGFF